MRSDFLIDMDKQEIARRFSGDDYLRNYYLNIWEYKTGQTVLESYPWHVTLPIADLCNARCTFCNSWLWGKNMLHPDQVAHFAPLLKYAKLVGLHGHGEPLVNPHLEKILPKVSESMDPIRLYPTGSSEITASFDLGGLSTIIGKLQDACHWR
jgi:hypothetical protein